MVRVQNYYATCVPYSGNKGSSGLSPGLLAAAVVVPVVVLAALAALGGWLWIRHQRRKKQALQDDGFKMPQAADGDVELGRPGAGQDRTDLRTIAPDGYNLAALKTDAVHGTNVAATGQPMMNQTSSASTAFSSITSSTLPSSTPVGSPMVGLQGSGATTGGAARLHGSADSACDPRMSAASASTAASSKRGDMAGMLGPGSGGQLASSADTLTEMQGAQEQRGSGNSGGGSGSGERTAAGSGIPPSLQVLLSQSRRSQGSVLKELELGPLIGKGSYGRVHKGVPGGAVVVLSCPHVMLLFPILLCSVLRACKRSSVYIGSPVPSHRHQLRQWGLLQLLIDRACRHVPVVFSPHCRALEGCYCGCEDH